MYIIIMAGGSGTRFWPASHEQTPKQFLTVIGSRPLIEQTFWRIAPLATEERVYLVVNRLHQHLTEQIFQGRAVQILAEPVGRNTAPCIGLAAIHVRQHARRAPMVVLPADHFIADDEAFHSTLRVAAELAEAGGIVTIGITPTHPETGYGYLRMADGGWRMADLKNTSSNPQSEIRNPQSARSPAFLVERFVEKPDAETARQYLASGQYLWNSGIFVFTPETILHEIEAHLPELYNGLKVIERAMGTHQYETVLNEVYPGLPNTSIDYGVMEKTRRPVYVVPGAFGWSDVGSWDALYQLRQREQDAQGNLIDGHGLILETRGTFIYSQTERLIATLGLTDVLIVDTPEGLLVADRHRSQDVRRLVEELKARERGGEGARERGSEGAREG
jgi:mannose-1-phosphate guanylyltransferase